MRFTPVILFVLIGCQAPANVHNPPTVATFSIVALDENTGELGVAVQSKFIAVGAVVPWAKAGVGAIATQAWANTTYGPRGLRMLASGMTPNQAITQLTDNDDQASRRQVGMVDAHGNSAAFTGDDCFAWAGHRTGKHYTVQGNILAGQQVVDAMAEAFDAAKGDLGDRMIAALEAGQAAGGDKRGRQSAALLIVKKDAGYSAFNDRYRDLRVDDHPQPIQELKRIYAIHKDVFRTQAK